MKITIIANPTAGRGRPFRKIERYIRNWPHRDWEVELIPTRGPEHAGVIARELLVQPPDVLAVCGGDGTMEEVVTSVPDPPFPVALLPAGTANVLAREFKLPADPVRALDIALKGNVRRVDLGSLKARSNHHFLLMVGIGLDAQATAIVGPAWKMRLGMAAYFMAVVHTLLTYSFDQFHIITNETTMPSTTSIIANAKGYGGGLCFTPQADMTDGILDILVIQRASRMEYARFILSSWLGKPRDYDFVRHLRARSLRVEGPRGLWVQADGELVGTLPIDVEVIPGKFPLIVPP